MRIKKLVKAAFAVIVFGMSTSVLADNVNTTIQEGDVNTNESYQSGRYNDNATYQEGRDNANLTSQRGRDNVNQTGQFGRGAGSINYNGTVQEEN